ncbi:hypothetical protein [Aequorivita sp. Q41]|uniref:hypothetical protein n=1 Tax=Aequorivita sp. Q41 TaxID=3153300 RepID=UPI0032420BAF
MTNATKPNTAFWIIAVLAVLWNLIGVFLWISESFLMTEELKASLPPEQVELMNNSPSWNMIVYGIATISGLVASLLLLMRKKFSIAIFALSLVAILILQLYWVFAMDLIGVIGPTALIMPLIVIAIAIFEYFYSKGAARNDWLS